MAIKYCYCGKELTGIKTKYCSKRCGEKLKYRLNKEKIIKRTKEWQKNNPQRTKEIHDKAMLKYSKSKKYKKAILKNYDNNPEKWLTRAVTHKHRVVILNRFDNKCTDCGSKENLEIHHLDYEWKKSKNPRYGEQTNLRLNMNKLKLLCRKCHIKEHYG